MHIRSKRTVWTSTEEQRTVHTRRSPCLFQLSHFKPKVVVHRDRRIIMNWLGTSRKEGSELCPCYNLCCLVSSRLVLSSFVLSQYCVFQSCTVYTHTRARARAHTHTHTHTHYIRGSSVGKATGYELDDRGVGIRVPVEHNFFAAFVGC
jgi:hypothetical protein